MHADKGTEKSSCLHDNNAALHVYATQRTEQHYILHGDYRERRDGHVHFTFVRGHHNECDRYACTITRVRAPSLVSSDPTLNFLSSERETIPGDGSLTRVCRDHVGIVVAWIGAYAIDRYGRRILLMISTVSVMISMILLGMHYLMLNYDYNPADMEWMVILSLLLFMLLFLGLMPVPNTLLSELFPSDLKSKAGFLGSSTMAIFAFIATKTYQPMAETIGPEYVFWLYALMMFVCLVYSYFWIPETKGKTLQVNPTFERLQT